MPRLSVCVAVYREHGEPNVATLSSDLGRASADPVELVVALNGISAAAADVPSDAVVVPSPVNRGVAPAWNSAARASSGDVLVFANDDVRLGGRSLDVLVEALLQAPDRGVVGPAGARWDIRSGRHQEWVTTHGSPPGDVAECDVVSGYLFACTRTDFDRVGGFDEFYAPASWEEIDFCTAMRAHGRRNFVVAGCDVDHEWGVSARQPPWRRVRYDGRSERLRSIHKRNRKHFLTKWAGAGERSVD